MDAYNYLLDKKVKPSLQRVAVMKYLMEHKTHPTVDEIYSDLSPEMPTLSKTTVYNTLKILTDSGACLALTIDDKNVRYDAETSLHAHFKCKGCGCIYDIPVDDIKDIIIEQIGELSITDMHVHYYGYCKPCKAIKEMNS